jgi:hypothetical protein
MLRAELSGSETCRCEQFNLTVSSRSPVLKLCRELIARGVDKATPLAVYRGSTLSLRVRSVGEAAGLCVSEGDSRPSFAAALPPDAFRAESAGAPKAPLGYRATPEPKSRVSGRHLDREIAPKRGASAPRRGANPGVRRC